MATRSNGILVDLRHVVYALSDALDLVGIDDVDHGKRVATMAATCAETLGLPQQERVFLFDLGMLHDIGVSTTETHRRLVTELDWPGSQTHCETGHALLRDFAPLCAMAVPILHHHTHWRRLCALPGVSPEDARRANLVFLVDRVDALVAPHLADRSLLMHTAGIRERVSARSGDWFDPALVEAFLAASASEAFWLQLEPRGLQMRVQEMLEHHAPRQASLAELRQLAGIFARIVDAKSPYTAQHSLGVSRLARILAERMGASAENCDKIEIAGLLHDLGKLRVPDAILDKPAKLDPRERRIIDTHSYETYRILGHIRGFEEITQWAACHHEEPDGTGYPFRKRGNELPLEARILRLADIFQALAQNRPYRQGLAADAVLGFLRGLVAGGRAEAAIVDAIARDLPGAMAAAVGLPASAP